MNLNELGFKFAFTVENFLVPKKVRDDPAYVKYLVRLLKVDDEEVSETLLTYHKCTDADYAEFAPPTKGSKLPF